jgi:hypothetical protein
MCTYTIKIFVFKLNMYAIAIWDKIISITLDSLGLTVRESEREICDINAQLV